MNMYHGDSVRNMNIQSTNLMSIDDVEAVNFCSFTWKVQILSVLKKPDCKWIISLISCNNLVIYHLWNWSVSTNSLALKAYVNSVAFNVCALVVCLISIWVEQNTLRQNRRFAYSGGPSRAGGKFPQTPPRCKSNGKPRPPGLPQHQQQCQAKCQRSLSTAAGFDLSADRTKGYSDSSSISALGLEKYEVLGLLVCSCLSLFAAFLLVADVIARIKQQPAIHEGRLGLGAILGLIAHLLTVTAYPDAGLHHVVCKALPCPTLKGVNPILGSNLISFVILCVVHGAVHFWELYIVDTAAAIAVVSLTVASMLPLSFFTASIIFQKLSHHMSEQLDKCLREALIIDGVLEFRNERFWIQSFGKLAGSLEVRIRKNADEHSVLRNVMKSLSKVVSTLSVQEFREPVLGDLSRGVFTQLPLEYYVDELLQSVSVRSEPRQEKQKNLEADEETEEETRSSMKIEEILDCRNNALLEPIGARQSQQIQPGYATLLRNDQDYSGPQKHYLFRDVPVTNALLLGSRRDLDDLHCSAKLCRPTC